MFFLLVFGKMESSYTIQFNLRPTTESLSAKPKNVQSEEPEGPIVERRCPVCKNDTMSYATLQLRSADEGQTVFFTCTKCKYVFFFVNLFYVFKFNIWAKCLFYGVYPPV